MSESHLPLLLSSLRPPPRPPPLKASRLCQHCFTDCSQYMHAVVLSTLMYRSKEGRAGLSVPSLRGFYSVYAMRLVRLIPGEHA